jgi:phage antirepressor YoqD-like protein
VLKFEGLGRTKLFRLLREKHIFQNNNLPYREYIDRKYFKTIEEPYERPDGSSHVNVKTLLLQPGLTFVRDLAISAGYRPIGEV